MANFDEAYKLTGHNEGGYDNNPSDHGGETFAGIARKFWPAWGGWMLIDAYKTTHNGVSGIDGLLKDPKMQSEISMFYKSNFWNVNKLDDVNDQQLADSVYDFGVNSGVTQAAKILQRCAGVEDDGIIGQHTLTAVNMLPAENMYIMFNAKRRAFYIELSKKPGQSQFLSSWLSRLKPYKLN